MKAVPETRRYLCLNDTTGVTSGAAITYHDGSTVFTLCF